MHLSTLYEWLLKIGSVHKQVIELGLDRIKVVARRLLVLDFDIPIIIVGGTNGKGSTVAGLESIYQQAGYRVGAFTSPIIFKHNEQVRLNGEEASDQAFCEAFEKIDSVRGEITLTPFEYHTLAALLIFKSAHLDVCLLEVGLGGRLDAVNIIDADISVVTSISIDHTEYLGQTREAIGIEKAGIFRAHHPAICGDRHPPVSLIDYAKTIGARLFIQGAEFGYEAHDGGWDWYGDAIRYDSLPYASLDVQNMSCVLMVVQMMQSRLPVKLDAIKAGLRSVRLQGRINVFPGEITEIVDVSHNAASVALLAQKLKTFQKTGRTLAVFSMLSDKDIVSCIRHIQSEIDDWFVAPLQDARTLSLSQLKTVFETEGIASVQYSASVKEAYALAKEKAQKGDKIVIFGSFRVVAEARPCL